jgi:GcrA cell cycle regulator
MQEYDSFIIRMWEAGYTATQIGKELKTSRSSILGRIFRLRQAGYIISSRPSSISKRELKPKPEKSPTLKKVRLLRIISDRPRIKPGPKPKPKTEKKIIPSDPKTIFELREWHCRYVISPDGAEEALFCGSPKERGSYCAHHAALCYIPLSQFRYKKPA